MSPDQLHFLIIVVVAGLAGLSLLAMGMWPGRRGDTLHCRSCNYNLTGITSQQCPECGGGLRSDTIVRGERHRKIPHALGGSVLLLLSLVGMVALAMRIDYIPFLPTRMLLRNVQAVGTAAAVKSWDELLRRNSEGSLAAEARSLLVDISLQRMNTAPQIWSGECRFLLQCSAAGMLPEAKQKQFEQQARQAIVPRLHVRPVVLLGEPICYRIEMGPALFSFAQGNWSLFWDDTEIPNNVSGWGMRGFCLTTVRTGILQPDRSQLRVGLHRVRVETSVIAHAGASMDLGKVSATAEVRVVSRLVDAGVKRIHDPAVAEQMRDMVHPCDFAVQNGVLVGRLVGDRGVMPHDMAFNVFIRTATGEQQVGAFSWTKAADSERDYWVSHNLEYPRAEPVTVILRSSDRAARKTFDVFEFWDGEIIYEDVPVKLGNPTIVAPVPVFQERTPPPRLAPSLGQQPGA